MNLFAHWEIMEIMEITLVWLVSIIEQTHYVLKGVRSPKLASVTVGLYEHIPLLFPPLNTMFRWQVSFCLWVSFSFSSFQTTASKPPSKPPKKENKKEKKEMSLLDFDDCKFTSFLLNPRYQEYSDSLHFPLKWSYIEFEWDDERLVMDVTG